MREGDTHDVAPGAALILVITVITMLLQAKFADRVLGLDVRSLDLHQPFAKLFVMPEATQTIVASASSLKKQIPRWIPLASLGLLATEVAEFAAGHLHHVVIHVPLSGWRSALERSGSYLGY